MGHCWKQRASRSRSGSHHIVSAGLIGQAVIFWPYGVLETCQGHSGKGQTTGWSTWQVAVLMTNIFTVFQFDHGYSKGLFLEACFAACLHKTRHT